MSYNHTTGDGDRIFAPVFADVWETHLKKMNGSDVKVYVALLLHTTQHDRTWFMSIDELAEDAGVGRDTARLAKDRLVDAGLFHQSWRYRDETGDYHLTDTRPPPRLQAKNVYKVNVRPASVDTERPSEGVDRGRKSASIDAENKHLVGAENKQQTITPTTQPPPEPQGAVAPAADAASPSKDSKTEEHPLPQGWQPDNKLWARMRKKHPTLDLHAETQKFYDYWHTQAGARSRKKDWARSWQNWLNKAEKPNPYAPKWQQASNYADQALEKLREEGKINNDPLPF